MWGDIRESLVATSYIQESAYCGYSQQILILPLISLSAKRMRGSNETEYKARGSIELSNPG